VPAGRAVVCLVDILSDEKTKKIGRAFVALLDRAVVAVHDLESIRQDPALGIVQAWKGRNGGHAGTPAGVASNSAESATGGTAAGQGFGGFGEFVLHGGILSFRLL
tara:strand:- start:388 stop:705 length:318 start_codon:yes stop_codon:yes gene_type:complete